MNESKRYLMRMVIVSGAFAFVCIVFLIIFYPKLVQERDRYAASSRTERELQDELNGYNFEYYVRLMDEGFFDMTVGGRSYWLKNIYPSIAKSFKYRIFINGKLFEPEDFSAPVVGISVPEVVVRIEEYVEQPNSIYNLPKDSLIKYSYLLTRGTGEVLPLSDTVETHNEPSKISAQVQHFVGDKSDSFVAAIEAKFTLLPGASNFWNPSVIFSYKNDDYTITTQTGAKIGFLRDSLKYISSIEVRYDIS